MGLKLGGILLGLAFSGLARVAHSWLSSSEVQLPRDSYAQLVGFEFEEDREDEVDEAALYLCFMNRRASMLSAMQRARANAQGIQGPQADPPLPSFTVLQQWYAGLPTPSEAFANDEPQNKAFVDYMHQGAAEDLALMKKRRSRRRCWVRTRAFLRHWVARARLQFPLRADRPADRAAMSKWLVGEMREHGIRFTHLANAVALTVRLALLPALSDLSAQAAADTLRTRSRYGRIFFRLKELLRLDPAPSHEQGYDP